MAQEKVMIKTIPLAHTKKGVIGITHLTEPYGPNSQPVVSIGISLKGEAAEPDWKAHIPYENIDALIVGLQEAKSRFGR